MPCGKVWRSEVHEAGAFVAWQGKDRCVCVDADVFLAKMLIEALYGTLRRVVVFAQVAEHDVLDSGMIYFRDEPCRFFVAQVSKRPRNALFQDKGIAAFLEHLLVVVRLNDDIRRLFDLLLHHFVEHSDIGGNG